MVSKMGKQKKKLKIKKKRVWIILFLFLIVICLGIGFPFYQKEKQKQIKKNYSSYVITTKKAILYNQKNQVVGSLSKNVTLPLKKVTDFSKSRFPIQDSKYYISYRDVKKSKKVSTTLKENYLTLGKTVFTKQSVTLSSLKKESITFKKGITATAEYEDEEFYYISLWNQIYKIKKEKKIGIREKAPENFISILHYEKLEDTCNDYSCTRFADFIEQIKKLKENGYYTISEEDFKNYQKEYIVWKPKALFITTSSTNEKVDTISKELGISIIKTSSLEGYSFQSNNQKTTNKPGESISRYAVKSYTSYENLFKMANQEEVVETEPKPVTVRRNEQGIAVLNYHFFYDPTLGESCNETICLEVSKFREHLEYLKNNGYKTLTMNEFKRWMYGEIELPTKSVLITIDDGAMGTGKHNGHKLIPLLEEYDMHATLFLIAGWWNLENYISPNLDIQSHTFDMHQYGPCGRGQLNCATYEEAKKDLERSLEIIGNKDSFCFPFYYYSDTAIQAVKDVGFSLAFVGGNRKATRSSNKYLVPRYPILSSITMNQFKNIVN